MTTPVTPGIPTVPTGATGGTDVPTVATTPAQERWTLCSVVPDGGDVFLTCGSMATIEIVLFASYGMVVERV